MKKMVLFAIGPDKPGLVSEVSALIHKEGGNLEDSRMATLAGDFALILLFTANDDAIGKIQAACQALEKTLSISTQFKEASQKQEHPHSAVHTFTATGHDQPGIVSRLSQVLAKNGANVISMDTSLVNLAFHGTPMFKVLGKLAIPESADMSVLRDRLEDVCEDMELLLDFEPY